MKPFSFLAAAACLLSLPCCTMALAGKPKDRPVIRESATREEVLEQLGKPERSETYPKPVALRRVPEIAATNGMRNETGSRLVAAKDEFILRGYYGGWTKIDSLAITSASTLWFLEPILAPAALVERSRLASEKHRMTVWYSPDGRFVHSDWGR